MNETINLKVSVIHHFQRQLEKSKSKTYYKLQVICSSNDSNAVLKEWLLDKTYEDFEELNKNLKMDHPKTLPRFPAKSILSIKTQDELSKRKDLLNSYLKECHSKKDIADDFHFAKFIELTKHTKDKEINYYTKKLTNIEKYRSKENTFENMIQWKNLLLIVANNPSIKYTDYKKKQLKDIDGPGKLLGASINKLRMKRHNILDLVFDSSISSLYLDFSYHTIYLGLSSGQIEIFQLFDCEEDITPKYIAKYKIHNSIIIGIAAINNEYIFTCSDKTIKIFNIQTNRIINGKLYYYRKDI